ncbi:hypothetical protein CHELA17_20184 [Chelatococcus asaccharovorans]|nr:hypothetical protein CHELA17_20184 [Chelatococcus asaccharovorans]
MTLSVPMKSTLSGCNSPEASGMNGSTANIEVDERPSVCPSGLAFATAICPIRPPAPGRFSTRTVHPVCFCISVAKTRPKISVEPPAPKGTMMVIGPEGCQSALDAPDSVAAIVTAAANSIALKVMVIPPLLF